MEILLETGEMKFLWEAIFMTRLIGEFRLWGHLFDLLDPVLWTKDDLAGGHHLDHLFFNLPGHSIFLKSFTSIDDMNR